MHNSARAECTSGLAGLHDSHLSATKSTTQSPYQLYSFSGDHHVCHDNNDIHLRLDLLPLALIQFSLDRTHGSPVQTWAPNSYSGSHLFSAKLWTAADQKPMVKKIWKKYEKSWDGPSSPKSKRDKNPSGSCHNHLSPFFEDVGVFRRQICPVTSGRVDNCVRVGQRPYACLTLSGSGVQCAANARHYRQLHILFSWWKRSRSVVSSHFCLILSWEIMVPGPSSFFSTNW